MAATLTGALVAVGEAVVVTAIVAVVTKADRSAKKAWTFLVSGKLYLISRDKARIYLYPVMYNRQHLGNQSVDRHWQHSRPIPESKNAVCSVMSSTSRL